LIDALLIMLTAMPQGLFLPRARCVCMNTFTPSLGTVAVISLIAISIIVYAIGWFAARAVRRRK
jgi:hypothetical protein